MDNDRLLYLLEKYERNECSEPEIAELDAWYRALGRERGMPLFNEFSKEAETLADKKYHAFREIISQKEVSEETPLVQMQPRRKWYRYISAAAVLLFLISMTVYFFRPSKPEPQLAETVKPNTNDVLPGGDKAVITLADGRRIVLDEGGNGQLAREGNTEVKKIADGLVSYNASSPDGFTVGVNSISTPRGGQYAVILPDGSKAWLNAASSLTFPTVFTGNERKVELKGEAYFEVAKNAKMPFKVKVNDMEVKVLGTHFNIMAYADESNVQATLLEGSIQLTTPAGNTLLKPGQQANVNQSGLHVRNDADTMSVMAWKNGLFKGSDLNTLLRQISRWYDVEIAYEGQIPNEKFGGEIPRKSNLSSVLKILSETKVHFRIEGKKLVVTP